MQIISLCLKINNWIFEYSNKIDINIHQSLTNSTLLIIVRFIALLTLSFRYYFSIIIYDSPFNITEYLTQFGYILTWIYFASVVQDYLLNKFGKDKISKKLKDWVGLLFEITICMQFVVTVLFWTVLYDYQKPFQIISFLKEVGVHGFPFVCLFADFSLNVYQIPKRHLLVCLIVGTCYLTLNIIYSLIIRPIYRPLDWVSVMCYVYVVVCYFMVILLHVFIRKFWQKYRKPKLETLYLQSENYTIMGSETIAK